MRKARIQATEAQEGKIGGEIRLDRWREQHKTDWDELGLQEQTMEEARRGE
jgi:hypothetical protein